MNNVMMLSVLAVVLITVSGCGKKHDAQISMDNNAVFSENVVSLTDTPMTTEDVNAIPVVVENAATAVSDVTSEVAAVASTDKPTPKNIQTALKNAGLYNGKVDGTVGPKTKKAIEAFQSQNGLKADGKVGPKTWKALSVFLNKPTEVVNPTAEQQAAPIGQ